jgi:predicted transcriptional regulator
MVELHLKLDAKVMKELEHEARLRHVQEADVAVQAIKQFLDRQAYKREMIDAAVKEADKGVFISSEAMMDWLERLEADPDAVPPEPDVFLAPRA